MAQDASKRAKLYNQEKGVALKGYDPVSYFVYSEPKKGTAEFAYTYQGITYWFSSATLLETFKRNPAKYEPQYGGWCAYAMGLDGSKVEVDPGTYKIIDNKLYLFYNFYLNNTLKKWNKDEAVLKQNADKNWGALTK